MVSATIGLTAHFFYLLYDYCGTLQLPRSCSASTKVCSFLFLNLFPVDNVSRHRTRDAVITKQKKEVFTANLYKNLSMKTRAYDIDLRDAERFDSLSSVIFNCNTAALYHYMATKNK